MFILLLLRGLFLSREHTWCYSWMPTYGSTDVPQYSDQHHLFPTNQNKANDPRSNHPLWKGCKTLFRNFFLANLEQTLTVKLFLNLATLIKAMRARALLYMSVKYNGVAGAWTFASLNNFLPTANETTEDLATLLDWNNQ